MDELDALDPDLDGVPEDDIDLEAFEALEAQQVAELGDDVFDDEEVPAPASDPLKLQKILIGLNVLLTVGVLIAALMRAGPEEAGSDVGDQIGGSLSGEGGSGLKKNGGKSHVVVGPLFDLPEIQAQLAESTDFMLTATMAVEVEDIATKADLELRTVQVRHALRAVLSTKRKSQVTGPAVESLRGELVAAINTVLPNGKAVQVWPQSWLVE